MKWNLLATQTINNQQELIEVLLRNRQIDPHDQEHFFHPKHPSDIKPQEVNIKTKELETATKIIKTIIKEKGQILVFGDYDADGITAAAILTDFLEKNSANVTTYLPDREKDGYGLSISVLEKLLKKKQYDLVITVDNGIVASKAVHFLKDQSIQVIITDHHQPKKKLPPADAIVHSTHICGAAVAWMLVNFYHQQNHTGEETEKYLDLVGIATIADVMELTESNRSFAKHGLKALQRTKRIGLKALMQVAKVKQREINAYHVGFMIGPRINAAGRLADASLALDLLLSQKSQDSQMLASKLHDINSQRQDLTANLVEQAVSSLIQKQLANIVVIADQDFHEGIIGLIAGRVSQKYHRPAIAITLNKSIGKASARSVRGVDITQLLAEIDHLFTDFGGHAMAAGFSFDIEKKDEILTSIKNLAQERINEALLTPILDVEANIHLNLVTEEVIRRVNQYFAPFGHGNKKPVFSFKNVKLVAKKLLGSNQDHLKILLADDSLNFGKPISGIAWRKSKLYHQIHKGKNYDVAGYLDLNHWKGKSYPQLIVKDLKPTKS